MTDGLTTSTRRLSTSSRAKPEGAILNKIVDCSDHCASCGTNDALFLVNEIWSVLKRTWERYCDQSQSLLFTTQTWSCMCAKETIGRA